MPVPSTNDETAEPQTLDEICKWNEDLADALFEQRASALRAIRDGSPVAARFVGMTEDDVYGYYEDHRRELDRLTVLNLVASAEATLRVDFYRRVQRRLKDVLSKAYRRWYKTLSRKKRAPPDFDEGGILDLLKKSGVMSKDVIGQFRECLPARHWIGHGRYWAKPVAVDRFDPDDVYTRAEALIRSLPP